MEQNVLHNAMDIWLSKHEPERFTLYVYTDENEAVKGHLGIFDTPEGRYVTIRGDENAASLLLAQLPGRAVLFVPPDLYPHVRQIVRSDAVYSTETMVIGRDQAGGLPDSRHEVKRLSEDDADEYSTFGAPFHTPTTPIDWTRERLRRDLVFGASWDGKLASVATVAAWLPQISVILGVETKPEFRRRGLGQAVVSTATREALSRSMSCTLSVRSGNDEALGLYRALGYQKRGEEMWVDLGTGMSP
jgi:ribosomal protein S18 acetylase RimI-like enzyme